MTGSCVDFRPSVRRICRQPSDTWSWITPDEICGSALAAVFAARKSVSTTDGEPWFCDDLGWSDRETFAHELVRCFAEEIDKRAAGAGLEINWLADGGHLLPRDVVLSRRRQVAVAGFRVLSPIDDASASGGRSASVRLPDAVAADAVEPPGAPRGGVGSPHADREPGTAPEPAEAGAPVQAERSGRQPL